MYRGQNLDPGGGANYVDPPKPIYPFEQGFAVRIQAGETRQVRRLDRSGWSDISFTGEYPIGFVTYRDAAAPVTVALEAFSPFIPLNADDSGLPATVLRYTVKNVSSTPVEVALAGWLENAVCRESATRRGEGLRHNGLVAGDDVHILECHVEVVAAPGQVHRPTIVFEDFESGTYNQWTVEGEAFGKRPAKVGEMFHHQPLRGARGRYLADSFRNEGSPNASAEKSDAPQGKLTSKPFQIVRNYVSFLIGGGDHPGQTCVNLRIDGQVVRTATGANTETLTWHDWDVRDLAGRSAQLEIVDAHSGGWGHLMVDQIEFADAPRGSAQNLPNQRDFGTMTLALVGKSDEELSTAALADGQVPGTVFNQGQSRKVKAQVPLSRPLIGSLGRRVTLTPGQEAVFTFVIAWHFPNLNLPQLGEVGQHYARRFRSARDVALYLVKHLDVLYRQTKLWHDTWYDSTLPYWLLDRVMGNTSVLATMTCVRFANGRFYGWEGIGCCDGTCGHVWQYVQAVARLFPELERSVREQVDFGVAFHADSGLIEFRGEYGNGYAVDAQSGYVLRAYREHQMSADSGFLRRVWPRAKKALEFLIGQDGNEDGIIENRQHNTLDMDLYGISSWLDSLYLAALRAGEAMAGEMGDEAFARRCRAILSVGQKKFVELLWNGSYFIHRPAAGRPGTFAYGDGCEIDQVMGQNWAFQVGLGRILDAAKTRQALESVWRYNFTPDVGPYRQVFKTGRWYALPGEGGLLICTFPKGGREKVLGPKPFWAEMYFNECQSGYEYQAAAGMVWEGLVQEGLAVTRAIHDRYHGARRNPWNEVECGDHYARCMAVYGVYVALCGYEYHGPRGHIGFAPKVTPDHFRAAFTGAEGWGTFTQRIHDLVQQETLALTWGRLRLKSLAFGLTPTRVPGKVKVLVGGKEVAAQLQVKEGRAEIQLLTETVLQAGQALDVVLG